MCLALREISRIGEIGVKVGGRIALKVGGRVDLKMGKVGLKTGSVFGFEGNF